MSLPAYIVSLNCAFEFGVLSSLILPMPLTIRKNYLRFLMTSPVVAKVTYAIKIFQIFVAILFVDSFRTAYIVTFKPEAEGFNSGLDGGDASVTAIPGSNSRKLLAERNMALTSVSLFLAFLIWRVYELNMENVRFGETAAKLQGVDTGTPIDEHRDTFAKNYDDNKPDHQAATRKRNLHNKEAPVPDHDDSIAAEKIAPVTSKQ